MSSSAEAFALGDRLYAEKPRAFTAGWTLWRAWHAPGSA